MANDYASDSHSADCKVQLYADAGLVYVTVCKCMWVRECCRISPSQFLAECRKRRLNRVVSFCCILHCLRCI